MAIEAIEKQHLFVSAHLKNLILYFISYSSSSTEFKKLTNELNNNNNNNNNNKKTTTTTNIELGNGNTNGNLKRPLTPDNVNKKQEQLISSLREANNNSSNSTNTNSTYVNNYSYNKIPLKLNTVTQKLSKG